MSKINIKTLNLSSFRSSLFGHFKDESHDSVVIISRRGKNQKALVDADLLEDLLESNDPVLYKQIKDARSESRLTHDQVFGDL